ncbi:MAG TPA: hypothetical protein VND96_06660 [Candidatus Micrarchaeaceae archaeon]|nr:hypothetical protein [Candidatus Micrarchaeaceae archaeon]
MTRAPRCENKPGEISRRWPAAPLKGYLTVPSTWHTKPEPAKAWIVTALELTGRMPPKVAAAKKGAIKKPAKTR